MEPIRRPKRARISKLDTPVLESTDEMGDAARLARGTSPHVRLRLDDGPVLATSDIERIVHQLKSPLAAISLEICLLDDTGSPGVDRVLRRIGNNVAMLERVANEIADVAAIERSSLVLERRNTELRSLLVEVLDRSLVPRERARCLVEAHAACLAWIDAPRIERVILTLVETALAASPRDAAIVIQLEQVGGAARLSVISASTGGSADDAGDTFERSSEGIGMFVCRRIVEAHGGTVGVESRPGTGTRLYFDLPTSHGDDRAQVLLVDDDARQLEGLALLLRREGLAVTTAGSGSAAITCARSQQVDVAIVDVELPDVSGKELVEQLLYNCPRLPIIVVSGHPADSTRVADVLDACHGRYLAKPIDLEALLAEVAHCARAR